MISLKELLENHENENIEFKESFIKLSKDFLAYIFCVCQYGRWIYCFGYC